MEYRRLSFLLFPAVSWAAAIPAPLSTDRGDQLNAIQQSNPISSLICTSNCHALSSSSSSSSQPLELREYQEYHAQSFHHTKYDDREPHHTGPHIPTSWKVAIGVNAFVLVITASILGMLVWILRKEYRKQKLLQGDPTYVGAKDGFGRRMKSARNHSRGTGTGRGERARAWSYDPIREEEEEGVLLGGLGLGLEGGNDGMSMPIPMAMTNTLMVTGPEKETLESAKGKGREGTKAKRTWKEKHVRFSSWGDEIDARDAMGVAAGGSGKENGVAALRADAHEYVQTP
ncbi:hypothetical protein NHQ30_009403 [Ciborinia camelliae]|nr:hypothetical protein NHQ30_009403 [Ciborinia camelliae]